MYSQVIWATDGSEGADAALVEARKLVDPDGKIVAVHVDQKLVGGRAHGLSFYEDEDERRAKMAEQVASLRLEGIDSQLVVRPTSGSVATAIAKVAEEIGAEAIVCGTRGLGSLSGAVLGSVVQRLLHHAPCPVVAIPKSAKVEALVH